MAGLYIHIPFCTQACSYCDFYFVTGSKGREAREPFMGALLREVDAVADQWRGSGPVTAPGVSPLPPHADPGPLRTVYIGGGTPSLIPPSQLHALLERIRERIPSVLKETTLEVNPENVSPAALKEWKQAGITRLSIGIQSFSDPLLRFMHRIHDANVALTALESVAEAGFDSWSADLIYGNPGQDVEGLKKDLQTLMRFEPPHISAYSLTVEQRTRLDRQVETGKVRLPESEEVARQMAYIQSFLECRGYERYEVSSYAKAGHRSVHNHAYWTHEPYLGLGPAAHSFLWGPEHQSAWRWSHPRDLHSYLNRFAQGREVGTSTAVANLDRSLAKTMDTFEELTLKQLAEERIMLGLRTSDGVSLRELGERYGFTFNPAQESRIGQRVEEGLMLDGESITLTPEGLSIADYLTTDLLAEE